VKFLGLLLFVVVSGCSSSTIPPGAKAVENLDKTKYLGKWYEIARLDFYFEKGLNKTSAFYELNSDGSIKVVNRGFDSAKNKWKESVGKAKFVGKETTGMLKVSFFGPFYGGYNILAIDGDYQYALIAGEELSYLWILSRTKTIPDSIKSKYLQIAQQIGYKTKDLIWVKQEN